MTGLTVQPVQVGATQFDRASNRQRHRAWRRRSLFRRRTVCRPASTEGGVAVPQPEAIEPTRTCDRRDPWFLCLCLRRRSALLGRGARPDDCQRRSDERSRDEHNASFSHAGPAFLACSAKDISARCPRVSMSAGADCNRAADSGIGEYGRSLRSRVPVAAAARAASTNRGLFPCRSKNSPRTTDARLAPPPVQSVWINPRTRLSVLDRAPSRGAHVSRAEARHLPSGARRHPAVTKNNVNNRIPPRRRTGGRSTAPAR